MRAAWHIIGPKLRAVFRNTRLPAGSPFQALTSAKSARRPVSRTKGFPSNQRTSLPSATTVPYPAGVKKAGIPAPPARILSAKVPCGLSSTSSEPSRNMASKTLFSPT